MPPLVFYPASSYARSNVAVDSEPTDATGPDATADTDESHRRLAEKELFLLLLVGIALLMALLGFMLIVT